MIRARAWLAAGCWMAFVLVAAGQDAPPPPQGVVVPVLTIINPTDGQIVGGSLPISATLLPETVPFRQANFSVDGQPVCAPVTSRPIECDWDAGEQIKSRVIRVSITLMNGERLVQSVTTMGLDLSESVAVRTVMVPVVATDNRGRFVPGLTQADFRVYEDDAGQPITYFQSQDVPLDLALAVDVSGSMEPIMPEVKGAVKRFVGGLKAIDFLTLIAFNERVYMVTKKDTDVASRASAVDRLPVGGRTSLNDAIVAALDSLGGSISRRALVVFSDGDDTQSLAPIQGVERRIRESDATLYIISQGKVAKNEANQQMMRRLATLSGGRAFAVENVKDLRPVLDEVLEDLSQHYLIAYTPSNVAADGKYRKIRVELPGNRRVRTIRARDGYYPPR